VQRSDWTNVRKDANPRAMGDGVHDDTAAIQSALDGVDSGKAVYLPPGVYRITRTLVLNGPVCGVFVVGHGRDTRLVWDGPEGGVMFRSNGAAYSRYIGLSWDGRGRAAVGFDHASEARFETEIRHEHEAFRAFTGYGIRVGHNQRMASAEILYRNCLFEDCSVGAAMLDFNDYDNTFDRCEFRRCGIGIDDGHGNFYARNCHFEGSRETDFRMHSEHGSSVRRCTSQGSHQFLVETGTIAPLTIQDCHVESWTDRDAAVVLDGSPVLLFDCTFTNPPAGARPPVRLMRADQKLAISRNKPSTAEALLGTGAHPGLVVVPDGTRKCTIGSASRRFLSSTAQPAVRIFDARRDFGAKGDGVTDDSKAIQTAMDAARKAGGGALAYLPAGAYVLRQTLHVTGRSWSFGGAGWRTGLIWRGNPGEPMVEVTDPDGVTIENMLIGGHDLGPMNHGEDIRVVSVSGRPCRLKLDEVFAYGMYQKAPERHGIRFVGLPAGSFIDCVHVQGNVRVDDCGDAVLLFRTSYEGTVILSGKDGNGLVGFLTRLATVCAPTLWIRDNRSVVMSDFYDEQSDSHLLLEGSAEAPPGRVTVTGPKTHLLTQQPVLDIRRYSGTVFFGQNQFYVEPEKPRIVARGSLPLQILIAGCFCYRTVPQFDLDPAVRLSLIGNIGIEDRGVDASALAAYAAALDDLRRLGEADLK